MKTWRRIWHSFLWALDPVGNLWKARAEYLFDQLSIEYGLSWEEIDKAIQEGIHEEDIT